MENGLSSGSVLDDLSSLKLRSDSKLTGAKRIHTESAGKSELKRKRIKVRDLESVLGSKGIEAHYSVSSVSKEAIKQCCFHNKDETSQITEETVTMISDASEAVRIKQATLPLLGDACCLSLGHVDTAPNPMDLNTKVCIPNDSTHDATLDTSKPSLLANFGKDCDLDVKAPKGTGLDLNAEDISHSIDQDPFYLYKVHGHVKSREASECGSSTGSLEENNSLRAWKEMKQNGFLSAPYGGIPMPKQRERKSKNDMLKKKIELAKREQINRFAKIAAPSGLLNELNPGIINHVRNSKQVHSIIEALVRSEKLENSQIQSRSASQLKRGAKEFNDRRKDPENMHDSGTGLSHEDDLPNIMSGSRQTRVYPLPLSKPTIRMSSEHKGGASDSDIAERRVCSETSSDSRLISDREDDTLKLKLSSSITMESENTSSVSNEKSANHKSVSSLSVNAATVASQWLELLYQDIRGRLAALQRSKKRVRAVVQTKLPFMMFKEFSSNQENDPYVSQSSTTPNMQQERWTALFGQMEKTLSEEGKHLELWLNQVKEMQLHCERGLQCANWTATHGLPQLGGSENGSRSKEAENSEKELAIRAAAASIYSTCNFVMSTENVSCF